MKDKDFIAASSALVDWLISQEIHPEDAPRVLTTTLIGLIHELAEKGGRDPKVGAQIIATIITGSLS
jgi:hypothetical protein